MTRLSVLFPVLVPVLVAATPTLAQQPDADFLTKALSSLQAQRNGALDAQAVAEAKAAQATEKAAKLEEQLKAARKDRPEDAQK